MKNTVVGGTHRLNKVVEIGILVVFLKLLEPQFDKLGLHFLEGFHLVRRLVGVYLFGLLRVLADFDRIKEHLLSPWLVR